MRAHPHTQTQSEFNFVTCAQWRASSALAKVFFFGSLAGREIFPIARLQTLQSALAQREKFAPDFAGVSPSWHSVDDDDDDDRDADDSNCNDDRRFRWVWVGNSVYRVMQTSNMRQCVPG